MVSYVNKAITREFDGSTCNPYLPTVFAHHYSLALLFKHVMEGIQ